jgi:hypothetical protein
MLQPDLVSAELFVSQDRDAYLTSNASISVVSSIGELYISARKCHLFTLDDKTIYVLNPTAAISKYRSRVDVLYLQNLTSTNFFVYIRVWNHNLRFTIILST